MISMMIIDDTGYNWYHPFTIIWLLVAFVHNSATAVFYCLQSMVGMISVVHHDPTDNCRDYTAYNRNSSLGYYFYNSENAEYHGQHCGQIIFDIFWPDYLINHP